MLTSFFRSPDKGQGQGKSKGKGKGASASQQPAPSSSTPVASGSKAPSASAPAAAASPSKSSPKKRPQAVDDSEEDDDDNESGDETAATTPGGDATTPSKDDAKAAKAARKAARAAKRARKAEHKARKEAKRQRLSQGSTSASASVPQTSLAGEQQDQGQSSALGQASASLQAVASRQQQEQQQQEQPSSQAADTPVPPPPALGFSSASANTANAAAAAEPAPASTDTEADATDGNASSSGLSRAKARRDKANKKGRDKGKQRVVDQTASYGADSDADANDDDAAAELATASADPLAPARETAAVQRMPPPPTSQLGITSTNLVEHRISTQEPIRRKQPRVSSTPAAGGSSSTAPAASTSGAADKGRGKKGKGKEKEKETNKSGEDDELETSTSAPAAAAAASGNNSTLSPAEQEARIRAIDSARGLTHEQMLTERHYTDQELGWLSEEYGLRFIRGRFTKVESDAVLGAIRKWQSANGVSNSCLRDHLDNGKKRVDVVITQVMADELWAAAARAAPGRPYIAVRRHAREKLRPAEGSGRWQADEVQRLVEAVAKHGKAWTRVAAEVGRTPLQCKSRWRTSGDSVPDDANQLRTNRHNWTSAEDLKLEEAVQAYCGENNLDPDKDQISWKAIAAKLDLGLTGHQCMKRYGILRPKTRELDKSDWNRHVHTPILLARMKEQMQRLGLKHESEIDFGRMTDAALPFSVSRLHGFWYRFSRRHRFSQTNLSAAIKAAEKYMEETSSVNDSIDEAEEAMARAGSVEL